MGMQVLKAAAPAAIAADNRFFHRCIGPKALLHRLDLDAAILYRAEFSAMIKASTIEGSAQH